MTTVLISNSDQNHPPEEYALATAKAIVPSDGINSLGIDPLRVLDMQTKIAMVIRPHFVNTMEKQKASLAADPTDFGVAHDIYAHALEAAVNLQQMVKGTFLKDVSEALGWLEEVVKVIGSNLATAAHVENLLHADKNPTMPEAIAYKSGMSKIAM